MSSCSLWYKFGDSGMFCVVRVGPHMYQQAQKVMELIVKPCLKSCSERHLDLGGKSDICKNYKGRYFVGWYVRSCHTMACVSLSTFGWKEHTKRLSLTSTRRNKNLTQNVQVSEDKSFSRVVGGSSISTIECRLYPPRVTERVTEDQRKQKKPTNLD